MHIFEGSLETRACVTRHILLKHPVWGLGGTSAERTSQIMSELQEILLEDLRMMNDISQTNKTSKNFPPPPVTVFSALRSAAICARRRILKPFSSDAACVAGGDNLINFQRGRKRRDVIYKKERCSIKHRIGEGRTLRNIQLSEQMLNAKAS